MGRLEGKVAVVTGGARGVGKGEAMLLAREGAAVVVNDLGGEWDGTGRDETPARDVVAEITAEGGTAVPNFEDVADWEGGQRLINQAIDTFGGLDILICNAGILRDRMLFNMTEEEWDLVVRCHLKGHFVPTRFAAAYWRQKSKEIGAPVAARLIFTASESGLYANPGQANYAAAKAGIASIGIVAAREMSRYGVTANTICPRARTRLTVNTFGDRAGDTGGGMDLRHADNVAPWVVFLCTDAAAHITGQTFAVGGGTVELTDGWRPVGSIEKEGRWTLDELETAWKDLFGDRPTEPSASPFGPPPPST